jgi:HPt (histidine-containing phosphotransfer) domain-containing protein
MENIPFSDLCRKILEDFSGMGTENMERVHNEYTPEARTFIPLDPHSLSRFLYLLFGEALFQYPGSFHLHWKYVEGNLHLRMAEPFHIRNSLLSLFQDLGVIIKKYPDDTLELILPSPAASPSDTSQEEKNIFDPSVLENAYPDPEFCVQVVEGFLDRCESLLRELECLEPSKDLAIIHRIAHSIKGGGLNIGARNLADTARELEYRSKAGTILDLNKEVEALRKEFSLLKTVYKKIKSYG